jgi:hypothetical protein
LRCGDRLVNAEAALVYDVVTSSSSWLGPTFGSHASAERRAILDRVLAIVSDQRFEIDKPMTTLMEVWRRRYGAWVELRQVVDFSLGAEM